MSNPSERQRPPAAERALRLVEEQIAPGRERSLPRRAARRAARSGVEALSQRPRIWKYRLLSTCPRVSGRPIVLQPVLFMGPGEVVLGEGVQFGWRASPLFYSGYCYVEAARPDARIEIGDRTEFNNNLMIKSEGAGIRVGCDGLFGAHVEIFDSNFHDLHPARRNAGTQRMAPVEIGDNVFVGMGVRILKGVTIGSDSVIGAGAVVSSAIPAGVIAAGNPAKVIREL
ncbi:MAG TPA: DapH/DapD/GlmU-related protein [Solirubrobacteraceae bacterium]|nr:DapH/DapD/GlmU-related protein [Solirubrobacteraceae bacterium]